MISAFFNFIIPNLTEGMLDLIISNPTDCFCLNIKTSFYVENLSFIGF